jgi:hypothetical protein
MPTGLRINEIALIHQDLGQAMPKEIENRRRWKISPPNRSILRVFVRTSGADTLPGLSILARQESSESSASCRPHSFSNAAQLLP